MVFCPNCGKENEDGSKFCHSCGKSLNFIIVGENEYINSTPQNSKQKELDEEIKIKEIERLMSLHNKIFVSAAAREPKIGFFTDDEILKYAPNSQAATKIRTKRANGFIEKIKVNPLYKTALILIIFIIIIIVLFTFLGH